MNRRDFVNEYFEDQRVFRIDFTTNQHKLTDVICTFEWPNEDGTVPKGILEFSNYKIDTENVNEMKVRQDGMLEIWYAGEMYAIRMRNRQETRAL